MHAGLHRADDIGLRIIAYVQHLMSLDAGHLEKCGVYSRVGFGCAGRARTDVAGEQIPDAAAVQIRVAVAESEQAITRSQSDQRWPHVIVELDPVARGEEHLERFVGERLLMARRAEQVLERAVAQEGQIPRNRAPLCARIRR